ncbi:MAG: glycosyltransferase family A protein [Candidatus Alcyoniella australis]|nr:glycosyltransferase family A protein [Candidatus Alcyoniella australis]
MVKLSIIVCTYNRSALLERCLLSLIVAQQKRPFELLVIDNNSTDDTATVIQRLAARAQQADIALRWFNEPEQGLSAARNRGFHEAAGAFVAYLDDDAFVDQHWIERALEMIHGLEPDVLLLGAKVTPEPGFAAPEWMPDALVRKPPADLDERFVVADQARSLIAGSNMIFRKHALERLGGFDPQLGRIADRQRAAEETELFYRLERIGRMRYTPRLVVFHPAVITDLTVGKVLERGWYAGLTEPRKRLASKRSGLRMIDVLCWANSARYLLLAALLVLRWGGVRRKPVVEALFNAAQMAGLFVGNLRAVPSRLSPRK